MLPARNVALWPEPVADIEGISELVRSRVLAYVVENWQECGADYGRDGIYLAMSLFTDTGEVCPSLRIEFGFDDKGDRGQVGTLHTLWNREERRISQLRSITVNGNEVSISEFSDALANYLSLDLTVIEISEQSDD